MIVVVAEMSGVTLRLDGERWREHLHTVAGATPGIVPVIKGNGYGFGLQQLAEESTKLGADTIAVGIPSEVAVVREAFPGDVVILNPWDASSKPRQRADQRTVGDHDGVPVAGSGAAGCAR